jgi:hypothetical protein
MQPATRQIMTGPGAGTKGEEWVARILRKTSVTAFVRILGNALTTADRLPPAILGVALERLRDHRTPFDMAKLLVRLMYRACARAYYCPAGREQSFEHLAGVTFEALTASRQKPDPRLVFQFLLGDINACLRELIRRYSIEALRPLDVLRSHDAATVRRALREEALLVHINDFLQAPLPEAVVPPEFGAADGTPLPDLVAELANERQSVLEQTSGGTSGKQIRFRCADPGTRVSFVNWSRMRVSLARLLTLDGDAPFAALSGVAPRGLIELAVRDVRIEVHFHFWAIDPVHEHGRLLQALPGALLDCPGPPRRLAPAPEVTFESGEDSCRGCVAMRLPVARPIPGVLGRLEAFFDFVDERNRRFFRESRRVADFVPAAYERFRPCAQTPFSTAPVGDWIECLRARLDRELAVLAGCFLFDESSVSPLHGVLHELKKHVQFAREALAGRAAVPDGTIAGLRGQINRLRANLHRAFQKSLHESDAAMTSLNPIVQAAVQYVRQNTLVPIEVDSDQQAYAKVDAADFENVLLGLLHNAVAATPGSCAAAGIVVRVYADPDIGTACVSVENPYDPREAPSKESSGRGLGDVRSKIRKSGGRFQVIRDERGKLWTALITFRGFWKKESWYEDDLQDSDR